MRHRQTTVAGFASLVALLVGSLHCLAPVTAFPVHLKWLSLRLVVARPESVESLSVPGSKEVDLKQVVPWAIEVSSLASRSQIHYLVKRYLLGHAYDMVLFFDVI